LLLLLLTLLLLLLLLLCLLRRPLGLTDPAEQRGASPVPRRQRPATVGLAGRP
jgi:hypothetical protein